MEVLLVFIQPVLTDETGLKLCFCWALTIYQTGKNKVPAELQEEMESPLAGDCCCCCTLLVSRQEGQLRKGKIYADD